MGRFALEVARELAERAPHRRARRSAGPVLRVRRPARALGRHDAGARQPARRRRRRLGARPARCCTRSGCSSTSPTTRTRWRPRSWARAATVSRCAGANAGAQALGAAARALEVGAVDAALVVAYDTLLEPETLIELAGRGALHRRRLRRPRPTTPRPRASSRARRPPASCSSGAIDAAGRALALVDAWDAADGERGGPSPATLAAALASVTAGTGRRRRRRGAGGSGARRATSGARSPRASTWLTPTRRSVRRWRRWGSSAPPRPWCRRSRSPRSSARGALAPVAGLARGRARPAAPLTRPEPVAAPDRPRRVDRRARPARPGAGGAAVSESPPDKRWALVTGASRGIGAAIARELAGRGLRGGHQLPARCRRRGRRRRRGRGAGRPGAAPPRRREHDRGGRRDVRDPRRAARPARRALRGAGVQRRDHPRHAARRQRARRLRRRAAPSTCAASSTAAGTPPAA